MELRVKVISVDSLRAIPFATVSVFSKAINVLCDENGFAQLDVRVGDTLVVRGIGYYSQEVIINSPQLPPVFRVLLEPQVYKLAEATISGIKNREELKRAIIKMRVAENPYANIKGLEKYQGPFEPSSVTFMSPITLIYQSDFAKRNRAKRWQKNVFIPNFK
jgi:hypothetical protein